MPIKSFKQATTKAAKIIGNYFDVDFLDIYRNLPETPGRVLLYSNIRCHYQIRQADNANPMSVDVMPIISIVQINMPLWVDIQNGDYLIVKRINENDEILIAYRGICGHPAVNHLRQTVSMEMTTIATPDEFVAPPPPLNPSKITIRYYDVDGAEIKATMETIIAANEKITICPAAILNFTYLRSYLDDELQSDVDITIADPKPEGHEILFVYNEKIIPTYFRILVDGAFTRNDGSLGDGFHLFKRIPFEIAEHLGIGEYSIVVHIDRAMHPEMGMLLLRAGTILKIFTTEEWVQVNTGALENPDGTFTFETILYTPTLEQKKSYEALWYD